MSVNKTCMPATKTLSVETCPSVCTPRVTALATCVTVSQVTRATAPTAKVSMAMTLVIYSLWVYMYLYSANIQLC